MESHRLLYHAVHVYDTDEVTVRVSLCVRVCFLPSHSVSSYPNFGLSGQLPLAFAQLRHFALNHSREIRRFNNDSFTFSRTDTPVETCFDCTTRPVVRFQRFSVSEHRAGSVDGYPESTKAEITDAQLHQVPALGCSSTVSSWSDMLRTNRTRQTNGFHP